MFNKVLVIALLASSATLAAPIPAGSSAPSTPHTSDSDAASRRSSMTDESVHAAAQAAAQAAAAQAAAAQAAQHNMHVVNNVANQVFVPPPQPNPVNLQPLTFAQPPPPRRRGTTGCLGIRCTILKRDVVELEARDFEELEARSSSVGSTPRTSNSGSASRRTSMTGESVHAAAQNHQQAVHVAQVVNHVANQAFVPPPHPNPVNMQPLTVVQPPPPRRTRTCLGISCAVMKRDVVELEARDFEELEARRIEELD